MNHFLRRQGWVVGLFALLIVLFIATRIIQPAYGSGDFGSLARAEKLSGRAARPGARIVLSPVSWSMRISGALRTRTGA